PFGKNRKHGSNLNPAANAVAGGWNVSAIVSARTGMPTTAYTWTTPAGFWLTRADCVGPVQYGLQPYSRGGLQWFNPSAFATPTEDKFGNCANSTIYDPGSKDLDLSLMKDFPIMEKRKLQFRADFINATNSKLLNAANSGLRGGMGVITGTQF